MIHEEFSQPGSFSLEFTDDMPVSLRQLYMECGCSAIITPTYDGAPLTVDQAIDKSCYTGLITKRSFRKGIASGIGPQGFLHNGKRGALILDVVAFSNVYLPNVALPTNFGSMLGWLFGARPPYDVNTSSSVRMSRTPINLGTVTSNQTYTATNITSWGWDSDVIYAKDLLDTMGRITGNEWWVDNQLILHSAPVGNNPQLIGGTAIIGPGLSGTTTAVKANKPVNVLSVADGSWDLTVNDTASIVYVYAYGPNGVSGSGASSYTDLVSYGIINRSNYGLVNYGPSASLGTSYQYPGRFNTYGELIKTKGNDSASNVGYAQTYHDTQTNVDVDISCSISRPHVNQLVRPGENVYVRDPLEGVNDLLLRCQSLSWPVGPGYGVYLVNTRTNPPSIIDVTKYLKPETSTSSSITLGNPRKALTAL